jgi:tripartite-type tricarboxylate transporter receptor subunit TctC
MDLTASLPLIAAGRIKALATTGPVRAAALPNVPTVAESGFANYQATTWVGIFAPKGMKPDHIQYLNKQINQVLVEPEVKAKGSAQGLEVAGSTPAQLQQFLSEETAKWRTVITAANIKLQ